MRLWRDTGRSVGLLHLTASAAAIAGGMFLFNWYTHRVPDRIYRIGADNAFPYYSLQPGGTVRGFAVDVLNDAAHRRGIRLQWVASSDPTKALLHGDVDLWPLLSSTPERAEHLHFTEPWLQNRYALISLQSRELVTPENTAGRRVSVAKIPQLARELASKFLPKAQLVMESDYVPMLEAVCSGKADAAFAESRYLVGLLLSRPRGCGTAAFAMHTVPGALLNSGIAARPDAAAAADSLRAGISDLARDGKHAARLDQWSPISSSAV